MDKLSKTGLKLFNDTYQRFLKDISKSFPDVSEIIKNNYLDKKDSKPSHYYLKHYMYEIYPHMKLISECNEKLFTEGNEPLGLLEGVNFRFVWAKADEHIRNDIWKYLHTLHLLSSFHGNMDILIENNHDNLIKFELFENVKEVQNNYQSIKEQINKYLTEALTNEFKNNKNGEYGDDGDDEDENNDGGLGSLFGSTLNVGDTLKSLMEKINNEDSEMFRLANDIMEGTDLSDLEELTKNPMDILNAMMGKGENNEGAEKLTKTFNGVIGKVLNKIQEKDIDMEKLKGEAEGLVGDVMGNMKDSDNFIGKMISNPNFMNKITQSINNPKMMETMTNMMSKIGSENEGNNGFGGLENLLAGQGGNNLFSMAQQMAQQNPELVNMARQVNNPHNNSAAREKIRRQIEAKRKRQFEEAEKQKNQFPVISKVSTPVEQNDRDIDELVREIEAIGSNKINNSSNGTKKTNRKKNVRKHRR